MGTDPIKMFCSQCGNRIASKDEKCPACGLSLTTRQTKANFLSGPFVQRLPLVTLSPGDTLMKRFQIRKHLGNGRFSSVYLASDAVQNKEVALKTVEVGPLSEDLADLRLKREMRVHNKITDHKYVVKVHDMHFSPWGGTGLLLLSMELADGGTFRRYLLEHAEDSETRRTQGLEYFKQACRGVGAVHEARAVHRDLKPENLLFSNEILKVSDFGSASYAQTLTLSSTSTWETPSLDEGTPTYMSPEHINAPHPEDVDFRTDIYSLGIILFELLHPKCRPPFGGSEDRIKECHLTVPAPYLKEAEKGMADIIAKCLEKDPANRYQTVWELLSDLEKGHCSTQYSAAANAEISPEAKKKEEHRKLVQETFQKALHEAAFGDLDGARKLTEEVLRMQPDHANAKQLQKRFETNAWDMEAIWRKHLSLRETKKHMEESLKNIAHKEDRKLTEEVPRIQPDHANANQLQQKPEIKRSQAEALYREIATNLEHGDLFEQTELLLQAIRLNPDHPLCQLAYTRILTRAERFIKAAYDASAFLAAERCSTALSLFREANQLCGTSTQLEELIKLITNYLDMPDTVRQKSIGGNCFNQMISLSNQIYDRCQKLGGRLDILCKAMER